MCPLPFSESDAKALVQFVQWFVKTVPKDLDEQIAEQRRQIATCDKQLSIPNLDNEIKTTWLECKKNGEVNLLTMLEEKRRVELVLQRYKEELRHQGIR